MKINSFNGGFLIGGLIALLVAAASFAYGKNETEKKKLEPCIQPDKPASPKKV